MLDWLFRRRRPSDESVVTVTEANIVTVRMKRGVGYCEYVECEDYGKGVFLLNHGDEFSCPRCRHNGSMVPEVGYAEDVSEDAPYKEVRIEYNYDPHQARYRELAVLRDESIWGDANIYRLFSPLIRTEKRAMKVAESILSNLQRHQSALDGGAIPRSVEIILSFDDSREKFSQQVGELGKEWLKAGETHRRWSERKISERKEV